MKTKGKKEYAKFLSSGISGKSIKQLNYEHLTGLDHIYVGG